MVKTKTNKIKTFAQPPFIPVKEEKKDNSNSSTIINLENNTPTSSAKREQYLELNKNFNIEIKPVNYYNNMYDFKSIIIKDNNI